MALIPDSSLANGIDVAVMKAASINIIGHRASESRSYSEVRKRKRDMMPDHSYRISKNHDTKAIRLPCQDDIIPAIIRQKVKRYPVFW